MIIKNVSHLAKPALVLVMWSLGTLSGHCFCNPQGRADLLAAANAADSSTAAQYKYGPSGEMLRATGPVAEMSPFALTTKYHDDETDLLYYGYRYYNPSSGTWLNRDPVHEIGSVATLQGSPPPGDVLAADLGLALGQDDGLNLYLPLRNDPLQHWDPLGTACRCRPPTSAPPGPTGPCGPGTRYSVGSTIPSAPVPGKCVGTPITIPIIKKTCTICVPVTTCTYVFTFTCVVLPPSPPDSPTVVYKWKLLALPALATGSCVGL